MHPILLLVGLLAGATCHAAGVVVGVDIAGAPVARTAAPSLSEHGDLVVFSSYESSLVPGDTNAGFDHPNGTTGYDVFVRNRNTCTTERVSLTATGGEIHGDSSSPSMSPDGRFVAFVSDGNNIVPESPLFLDQVYLRDRLAATTELISITSGGDLADGRSSKPRVSADGRFVAFTSYATNLVPGDVNGNGVDSGSDVFLRDRILGTTQRLSIDTSGSGQAGESGLPAISADGRFVVFGSSAPLISGDPYVGLGLYLHDREAGALTRLNATTERANVVLHGPAAISGDGCIVVFAGELGDESGLWRYDCQSAASRLALPDVAQFSPLSTDGTKVAVVSSGDLRLHLHDFTTGTTTLVPDAPAPVLFEPLALAGNGEVSGTAQPVTVYGPAPAVPSACEAGDVACNPSLPPVELAGCILAHLFRLAGCDGGSRLPASFGEALGVAQDTVSIAHATLPAPRHETRRVVRQALRSVKRVRRQLRMRATRSSLQADCWLMLRQLLRDVSVQLQAARRSG